jgi:ferredoxin
MGSRIKRPSIRRLARKIAARATGEQSQPDMPTGPVMVEFEGHEPQEIPPGSSLLHAALRMGVDLSHYCGGNCSCGSCKLIVLEGANNLSRPQPREEMVLGHGRTQKGERLGCQSRILGPVRVRIPDWFQGE